MATPAFLLNGADPPEPAASPLTPPPAAGSGTGDLPGAKPAAIPRSPLRPGLQRRPGLRPGALALFAVALVLTAALVWLLVPADLSRFGNEVRNHLRTVSLLQLSLGVLALYAGLFIRAIRWALLMPRGIRPRAQALIASQFAGFAAVAIFGRVADLTRPYLVARRTETSATMQVGIYTVERAMDVGATAILFSVTLLLVPRSMPHHAAFSRAGILAGVATVFLVLFACLLRLHGQRLAAWSRLRLRAAPRLAEAIAGRLLQLQIGFSTVSSPRQLGLAFAWSLAIWFGIALSYLFVAHSLPGTPQLAQLTLPAILLLMATSMGAALLQLPIIGWFTQVAALAAAYHGFFGVPPAAASLCSLLTFGVNTLCVIPPGVLLAYSSGLSLRDLRKPAKAATEPHRPASPC